MLLHVIAALLAALELSALMVTFVFMIGLTVPGFRPSLQRLVVASLWGEALLFAAALVQALGS